MAIEVDPVELTQALVRCASVTPEDAGAQPLLETVLTQAGFTLERADRGVVRNLIAHRPGAKGAPVLGFNGHTDVVPTGPVDAWRHDPFSGVIRDGRLFGRGAVDMKSGVAAFVAAACASDAPTGLILTITGDEEGPAVDGTLAILDKMEALGLRMDACLVGEPTCPETLGDMMKIGRRGSLTARITAHGTQGHVAYPHRAANPLHPLVRLLDRLAGTELDNGTEHFDPSTLALTTIDTGNSATNVIPPSARAVLNIRYNDRHDAQSLTSWITREARALEGGGVRFDLDIGSSGDAFVTPPGPFSALIAQAVAAETGRTPVASTSGGTSDARFMRNHCPVVEFGLVGRGMHEVDEAVPVEDIVRLSAIYRRIIDDFAHMS